MRDTPPALPGVGVALTDSLGTAVYNACIYKVTVVGEIMSVAHMASWASRCSYCTHCGGWVVEEAVSDSQVQVWVQRQESARRGRGVRGAAGRSPGPRTRPRRWGEGLAGTGAAGH